MNINEIPQLKCFLHFRVDRYQSITGRNEVVAKVIFLHLPVILFTGGVLPQCMLGYPPGSRPPWDQTPQEQTPPPNPGKQTPAYGLRAAGTHPTGMHSCEKYRFDEKQP